MRSETPSRFLWSLVRSHLGLVLGALGLTLLAAIFEGSTMGIFAMALETISGSGGGGDGSAYGRLAATVGAWRERLGVETLFLILVGLAVVSQLARSGLEFSGKLLSFRLLARAESRVRRRLFSRFITGRFAVMQGYRIGDLASHLEHAVYVGQSIQRLSMLANQLLILAAYLAVLLWLSWRMTLVAVVAGVVLSLSLSRIIRRVRRIGSKFKSANVAMTEKAVEYLSGMRLVRAFARERHAIEQVSAAIDRNERERLRGLVWQSTISPIVDTMTVLGIAVFLGGGMLLLGDQGSASLPRLATFLFVLYRLTPKLRIINDNYAFLSNYGPFLERTSRALEETPESDARSGSAPFVSLRRGLELVDVSMRYGKDDPEALNRVSFTIERGTMVALVGESGAGKSTLADLLLRLYDPTGGAILVDGVDLRDLDWTDWRDRIGVVDQTPFLFHASVRDNIAFGRLEATEEEIVAAARAAYAHEFISELTDGYDTVVGDQGFRLSGGQRQRLAIARAVVRRPEILILDEATSDLDSRSERMIQRAIAGLRRRSTVVAIAHRLSTVSMADEIVVLERGRVVERGRHDALLAEEGAYARLWAIQVGGEAGDSADAATTVGVEGTEWS